MSAQLIYDLAPLGAIVRFSDGTPRPPDHHTKKLSAWENTNSGGRLIRKRAEHRIGNTTIPASITLHQGDYGSRAVIVLRIFRTFSVDSNLRFVVTERPDVSSVRIFNRAGEDGELVHVAASRRDAEAWLQTHGYPDAVLDEVKADDVTADLVEGRAA